MIKNEFHEILMSGYLEGSFIYVKKLITLKVTVLVIFEQALVLKILFVLSNPLNDILLQSLLSYFYNYLLFLNKIYTLRVLPG